MWREEQHTSGGASASSAGTVSESRESFLAYLGLERFRNALVQGQPCRRPAHCSCNASSSDLIILAHTMSCHLQM